MAKSQEISSGKGTEKTSYKLTIIGFDSGLNELLNAVRYDYKQRRVVNYEKLSNERLILRQLRVSPIRNVKLKVPIELYYHIYAKDRRHDRMNIGSAFDKCFCDALQKSGILSNDKWDCILNAHFEFDIDSKNPRVEVTIVEK